VSITTTRKFEMRKVKFVSAFTLLALLLSISQTVGLAQAPQQVSPSPTLLDLDGPVSRVRSHAVRLLCHKALRRGLSLSRRRAR